MLSQKVIWQNVLTSNLIIELCSREEDESREYLESID